MDLLCLTETSDFPVCVSVQIIVICISSVTAVLLISGVVLLVFWWVLQVWVQQVMCWRMLCQCNTIADKQEVWIVKPTRQPTSVTPVSIHKQEVVRCLCHRSTVGSQVDPLCWQQIYFPPFKSGIEQLFNSIIVNATSKDLWSKSSDWLWRCLDNETWAAVHQLLLENIQSITFLQPLEDIYEVTQQNFRHFNPKSNCRLVLSLLLVIYIGKCEQIMPDLKPFAYSAGCFLWRVPLKRDNGLLNHSSEKAPSGYFWKVAVNN